MPSIYYIKLSLELKPDNVLFSEIMYKGCIYDAANIVDLQLPPGSDAIKLKRKESYVCKNGDGCNPASRSLIDTNTILISTALLVILSCLRKSL